MTDIASELAKLSPAARALGPREWRLPACERVPLELLASIEDPRWLVLEAQAFDPGDAAPAELARRNATLPGLTKLVALSGPARLCAELPLGSDARSLAARVRDAREALGGAGAARAALPALDPLALCDEAGWRARPGSEGRALVDLSGPRGMHRAEVAHEPDSGPRIWVPVVAVEEGGAPVEHALAILLLAAGAVVRMARGALVSVEGTTVAGFEVRPGAEPSAEDIGHALSALYVACELCGPELSALADPAAASIFVRSRGALSPRTRRTRGSSHAEREAARVGHVGAEIRPRELRADGLDGR